MPLIADLSGVFAKFLTVGTQRVLITHETSSEIAVTSVCPRGLSFAVSSTRYSVTVLFLFSNDAKNMGNQIELFSVPIDMKQ